MPMRFPRLSGLLPAVLATALLAAPAAAAPQPTTAPSHAAAASAAVATAGTARASAVTATRPRASVAGTYVVLASGKVKVSVTSNAKKVTLTYRTASNHRRTATITIRKGKGSKTLAKGSRRITAKARSTRKLRASLTTPIGPAGPPVVDTSPPGPVTGLTVGARTTSSIALSWTNPAAADLAAIIVRRAAGSTPPASASSGTAVTLATPTATGVTDTGLAANSPYSYAVFTRDTTGNTTTTGVTVTTSTLAVAPTLAITTTTLPAALKGSPYSATLTATGGTGLVWSITSGTLPAGLSLASGTGLISGTPTATGVAALTVKVVATGGASATRDLTLSVISATADWPQSAFNAGARAWNGAEDLINPDNVAGISETFSLPSGAQWSPVIVGTTAYVVGEVPDRDGTIAVIAIDLPSGEVGWYSELPPGCPGTFVAVTSSAAIVSCGAPVVAVGLAAPHDILWNTADTDPGMTTQHLAISGSTVVAWGPSGVIAYRASDGQRLWRQAVPSGASEYAAVAVEGNTVIATYSLADGGRMRALRLDTGAQAWIKTVNGFGFGGLVAADGWVYTNNDGGAQRFSLADGSLGWSSQTGASLYRVLAADADTVYLWQAAFDFGPPDPSNIVALNSATGAVRWTAAVPSRVFTFGVTKRLVWVVSSDISTQGHSSDLLALNRSTGAQLKRITFADDAFGTLAIGNGYVTFPQGGSLASQPARLRVFSLASPLPVITTRVVPVGRVGVGYSATLEATGGTGTKTWSVASGALPAGLTLTSAGVLHGTPTAAGSVRVTVRVTDAKGRTRSRAVHVEVLGASSPDWLAAGRDGTRAAWNTAETALDPANTAQLGFRWKTTTSTDVLVSSGHRQPVVVGDRMYDVDRLGRLNAWSTTGTTTNRAPVWTKLAVPNAAVGTNYYLDSPVASAGVLFVQDVHSYLEAVSASTGTQLWRRALPAQAWGSLLVVGDKVATVGWDMHLRAFSTATGADAWGGLAIALDGNSGNVFPTLSTDGTRIFVVDQCEVRAFKVSDGTQAWRVAVKEGQTGPVNCGVAGFAGATALAADGAVFATAADGSVAVNAATGAIQWRAAVHGYGGAIANGMWLMNTDTYAQGGGMEGHLVALDLSTGEVLWRNNTLPDGMSYSAAGDLLVGRSMYYLKGFSLLDGQEVWDGGPPENIPATGVVQVGAPSISGGRILLNTDDGIKAFSLP